MSEELAARRGGAAEPAAAPSGLREYTTAQPEATTEAPAGEPGAAAAPAAPGKRRGRPFIGNPHTVRLPEQLERFALAQGGSKGGVADGVRSCVAAVAALGRPLELSTETARKLEAMRGPLLADRIEAVLAGSLAGVVPARDLREHQVKVLERAVGPDLLAVALELGGGDAILGIRRALGGAQVMSVAVFSRIAPENPGSAS